MARSDSQNRRSKHPKKVGGGGGDVPAKKGYKKSWQAAPVITFDAEARQNYLRGFHERKQKRRLFGLAMQKIKDRKSRLEDRANMKQSILEQIEQAEMQKEELLEQVVAPHAGENDCDEDDEYNQDKEGTLDERVKEDEKKTSNVKKYEDEQTQLLWGGEVVVTTSTHIPGDESDADEVEKAKSSSHAENDQGCQQRRDVDQEYAGNVEKYINQLKGKIGLKKRKTQKNHKRGGQHGAAGMKGIAKNASDLKLAQKVLLRSKSKVVKSSSRSNSGGKRRR